MRASAWSRTVSAIDLGADGKLTAAWSLPVAREPRGIAIQGGTAYVSHLTSADLTKLTGIGAAAPPAKSIASLPPSPLRAPSGKKLAASLGYAIAIDPAQGRLFAARHALGALGRSAEAGEALAAARRINPRIDSFGQRFVAFAQD